MEKGAGPRGVKPKERVAFAQLLVTGDKAAGKTTWINGLTTGSLRILQAMRYDAGVFYNIWYAPAQEDLEELSESISRRKLPFFQTELAHGAMLITAGELRFFLEDEELADDDDPGPSEATCALLGEAEQGMVRLLELGGDGLHELRMMSAGEGDRITDPTKLALLRQTAQTVRAANRVAYFVSLSSLLHPNESQIDTAGEGGAVALTSRLRFIREAAPQAELVLLCTTPREEAGTCVGAEAAARIVAETGGGDSEELARMHPMELVKWLAHSAGIEGCRVYRAEHLSDEGLEHHECLRTLRRLLRGESVLTPDGAMPVVAEQAANLLLSRGVHLVNKDAFAGIIDDFEGAIEGADVYRCVVHPMVVLPPATLLAHFNAAAQLLSEWGLLAPAFKSGGIPLVVDWQAKGGERGTWSAPGGEADCWRVIRLPAAVAEARRGLNLFTGDAGAHQVPTETRDAVLQEAMSLLAHCDSESVPEALFELYMNHSFLLRGSSSDAPLKVSLPETSPAWGLLKSTSGNTVERLQSHLHLSLSIEI